MARTLGPQDLERVSPSVQRVGAVEAPIDAFGVEPLEEAVSFVQNAESMADKLEQRRQALEDDAYVSAAVTAGREVFNDLYNKGTAESTGDASGFTKRFSTQLDAEIKVLPSQIRSSRGMKPSEEAKRRAEIRLQELRGQYTTRAATFAHNQRVSVLTQGLDQDVQSAATQAFNNPESYGEILQDTLGAIEGAEQKYLTPEQAKAKRTNARQSIAEGAVRGIIAQDPALAVEMLKEGSFDTDLDANKKRTLLASAEREVEIARDKAERTFVAGLETYVTAVSSGGEVSEGLAARYSDQQIEANVSDPMEANALKAARADAERHAAAAKSIQGATPDQQVAILEQAAAEAGKAATTETELGLVAQNQQQFQALQSAIIKDQEARNKDSAQYVLKHDGTVNSAYNDYAENPSPETYAAYASAREKAYERLGISPVVRKPLSKAQAKDQVAFIVDKFAQNPEDTAVAFATMAEDYGRDWPRVLGQLTGAGLPSEAAAIAYTDNASAQQTLVMAARAGGIKAIKEQIEKTDREAIDTAITQDLGSVYRVSGATNPAFANTIREGARTIAYFMTLSGTAPETAAQQAMDVMFNQAYQVVDQPSVKGIVPKLDGELNALALTVGGEKWIEQSPALDLTQFAGMGNFQGITPEDAQNTARAILRNNGVWYLNEDGKTMTLTAPGLGLPVEVLDQNGNPVTVKVSEIETLGRNAVMQRNQMQSPDDLMLNAPSDTETLMGRPQF